jgi:hypothetical protein
VFSLIAIDGTPSICPEAAISALQATEALRATQIPENAYWAPGMACRLATGPFQRHQGVVLEIGRRRELGQREDMALVAILMFGHLREVSVPLDCLTTRDE